MLFIKGMLKGQSSKITSEIEVFLHLEKAELWIVAWAGKASQTSPGK